MNPSNSISNKLFKKSKKYSRILRKETDLKEASESKCLMVCNAGLVNGIQLEKIVEIFSDYSLQQIEMIPGKSYSFVEFIDDIEARVAYCNIHGKLILPEIRGPVYLLFVDKMPESHKIHSKIKPEGLLVIDEFINVEEEQFLKNFAMNEFQDTVGCDLKNRIVKHFGYEFNYKTNNVNKTNFNCKRIPEELNFIISRLNNFQDRLKHWIPDQLTINIYQPGQGIPPHIDTHSAFDDIILSLSIGSDVVMDFRNEKKDQFSILLQGRSLLMMSDEARYRWTHGITPRKYDVVQKDSGLTTQKRNVRISFTFRRTREKCICNCLYSIHCDSQNKSKITNEFNINDNVASELERIHVHQVYEEIACHFSETRHKPWPNVEQFVRSFEPGSIFVDVGCGNGKYFGLNTSIFQIGCDRSKKLSCESYTKANEAVICDCLQLPFRSEIVNYCVCIAVIHHLCTEERRIQAIKEITRILSCGGLALIYVWAKNQSQDEKLSSYLKQKNRNMKHKNEEIVDNVSYSIKLSDNENKNDNETNNFKEISLPVHVNRTQFQHKDVLVPWKMKPTSKESHDLRLLLRYYHVFSEGELENLCASVDEIEVVKSYYDQGNWCVIIRKICIPNS